MYIYMYIYIYVIIYVLYIYIYRDIHVIYRKSMFECGLQNREVIIIIEHVRFGTQQIEK